MVHRTRNRSRAVPAMALVLAVFFGSLVTAGPEMPQEGQSWPHEIQLPEEQTAYQLLRQIHEFGLAALSQVPEPERPPILRVIRAAFACASYDGKAEIGEPPPEPLPAHAAPHEGAKGKIQEAWNFLHMQPTPEKPQPWADWVQAAEALEHGHD